MTINIPSDISGAWLRRLLAVFAAIFVIGAGGWSLSTLLTDAPAAATVTASFVPPPANSLPTGIAPSPTPIDFTPAPELSSTPLSANNAGVVGIEAVVGGLRTNGVVIVDASGQRVLLAGANLEMFRDYANGCGWVTDGSYAIRSSMATMIRGVGVNIVRLNYSYRFLAQGTNLSKFLDMAQELVAKGLYVMPSDHSFTGNALPAVSATEPSTAMWLRIIDGFNQRGIGNSLVVNPWNEPGPNISTASWKQTQKNMLTILRQTAGYQGLVVLDGTGWATLLDVAAFQDVMTFDASLRSGVANVAFSHHLYPNITDLPAKLWPAAKQVPLLVGELGQENPGASPLDPDYVKRVIAAELSTGLPNGHNGLFGWIWAWCDTNNMLQDWTDPSVAYSTKSPLTTHGVIWRDNYYAKLPAQATVPPPDLPSATPTTPPASATPRPASATPSRTPLAPTAPPVTPSPTWTPSITPSPSPTPEAQEHWQIDIRIESGRLIGDIYRIK